MHNSRQLKHSFLQYIDYRKKKKEEKQHLDEKNVTKCLLAHLLVCNRRAARQAQFVAILTSRLQLDRTTKHESCHLLLLICMSFDQQSAPTKTRSLCARKEKKKKIQQKEFPKNVVCGRIRRL
jgi:hypothetical protein